MTTTDDTSKTFALPPALSVDHLEYYPPALRSFLPLSVDFGDRDVVFSSGPQNLGVYKHVDKKVRPLAGTISEVIKVTRRFPEDPLESHVPLTKCPPEFVENRRLTAECLQEIQTKFSNLKKRDYSCTYFSYIKTH